MVIRFLIILAFTACSMQDNAQEEEKDMINSGGADVIVLEVSTTGSTNNYTFSVKLESPDEGCDQYADWWEVIDEGGNLIYRRNLGHSHVNEQPFIRSGGPVKISDSKKVWIRGHMNNSSYGTKVISGSIDAGFKLDSLSADFAIELEKMNPLPSKCAF